MLHKPMVDPSRPLFRRAALIPFFNGVAIVAALALVLVPRLTHSAVAISIYGALVMGYVITKIVLAEVYRVRFARAPRLATDQLGIDVAIAFFNEDKALIEASINSVLSQEAVLLGRIIAVDDGSPSPDTARHLEQVFRDEPRVQVIRYAQNVGKRHALGMAFDHLVSPYAALLDSDTILQPMALANLLARMDERTAAVTANINALNRNANWLSRLIDARYRSAFMIERAAQSVVGAALCASGVLSVYRTGFLRAVKAEWTGQRLLGRQVQFGDDRRLTALALKQGRVAIVLDAVASTQVPTSPIQFIKQQLRWNKSFLRESVLAVRDFGVLSFPGLFSFCELFFWLFYLYTIGNTLIFDHVVGAWSIAAIWLSYVIASGLFRNVSLIIREPRLVVLVPLYSVLHVLILTPLRLVALFTILDNRWGTR